MNYLAHAYLSFGDKGLLAGNMISDFIKGNRQYDLPPHIFQGVKLHRAIDEFTDLHPATKIIKEYFRPAYRLYAGAFADVVYDHFLANDDRIFENDNALKAFTGATYSALNAADTYPWLGDKFSALLPYMSAQDWLYHYRFRDGMRKSFSGLMRRSAYIAEVDTAFEIFEENHAALSEAYNLFFPEVEQMAKEFIKTQYLP